MRKRRAQADASTRSACFLSSSEPRARAGACHASCGLWVVGQQANWSYMRALAYSALCSKTQDTPLQVQESRAWARASDSTALALASFSLGM
eukprot:scaffold148_cov144-Isochrysis_galbana.AAC.13